MNQTDQVSNDLSHIPHLTLEQIQSAKMLARQSIIDSYGPEPRPNFRQTPNRFPPLFHIIITLMSLITLAAAFIISSIRLYHIGSMTFAESIQDRNSIIAAGIATVLLAEVSQVVSTLALAAFGDKRISRLILYAVAGLSTLVAIVGNVQVALPQNASSPFAWLDAFVPPLIVLGIAYVLKSQLLSFLEVHFYVKRDYEERIAAWEALRRQDPEAHQDWEMVLASALKDAIYRANSRNRALRRMMQNLDAQAWMQIVQRELALMQNVQRLHVQVHPDVQPDAPAPALPMHVSAHKTGEVSQAARIVTDEGIQIICQYCGYSVQTDAENEHKGRKSMVAHYRFCKQRSVSH